MIEHRLNSTLTVYRGAFTNDGAGGRTEAFTEHGTIRAQVNQPSEQERLAAAQLGAELSHVIHTTYGADVERGDQLATVDGGRRLRVRAVFNDSRRTYKRLDCEVAQGG